MDILKNNPYVDEILAVEDTRTLAKLLQEKYDLVYHPDASPHSAPFASIADSDIKKGFGLDNRGKVYPFDEDAVEWFEMGAFDNLKKANKKTYQQIIHEIGGFDYDGEKAQIMIQSIMNKTF